MQEEAEEAARKAAAEQKRVRQQVPVNAAATAREKENVHYKPSIESRKGVVYLRLNEKLFYSRYCFISICRATDFVWKCHLMKVL